MIRLRWIRIKKHSIIRLGSLVVSFLQGTPGEHTRVKQKEGRTVAE